MNVKLMNDLVVKYSLEKIGQFASICKNGKMPPREQLRCRECYRKHNEEVTRGTDD